MNIELHKAVISELCPEGNWRLTDTMETLLKRQISRLPRATVSQEETRYPTTPAGMRAFLDTFFARHYFQIQDSLIDFMTSPEFLGLLKGQEFSILDIGSGPAVASLAITEIFASILRHLRRMELVPKAKTFRISYVLNDTASICLGTGQKIIRNYFQLSKVNHKLFHSKTFAIEKAFPQNINQLSRICQNTGSYSVVNFSYVMNPLNNEQGLKNTTKGLADIELLCHPNSRILIVQDKFSKSVLRKFAKAIGQSCQKGVLNQRVYSTENDNETYTYTYYRCLFAPRISKANVRLKTA